MGLFVYGAQAGIIHRPGAQPAAQATTPTAPASPKPTLPTPAKTENTFSITTDTVLAFYETPATDPADEENRGYLIELTTELIDFLKTQPVDLGAAPDPMVGTWGREMFAEVLTFDGSEFFWYDDGANLTDNYRHGVYLTIPGCILQAGDYSLTALGQPCYSTQFKFTDEMVDGQRRNYVQYASILFGAFGTDVLIGNDWASGESISLTR